MMRLYARVAAAILVAGWLSIVWPCVQSAVADCYTGPGSGCPQYGSQGPQPGQVWYVGGCVYPDGMCSACDEFAIQCTTWYWPFAGPALSNCRWGTCTADLYEGDTRVGGGPCAYGYNCDSGGCC